MKLSCKRLRDHLLRLGVALLAVGLLGALSPAAPGAHSGWACSLPLITPAYAQDQGNANNGNGQGNANNNGQGNANNDNGQGNAGNNQTNTSGLSVDSGTSENVPIGPNDILHVDVVGQSDLTSDYQVDNNGDITMPYIGRIHVGGLQPEDVAPVITKKLDTIYNDVTVTVTRRGIGGINITLTGAMEHQGSAEVRRDAHLNDVLQQAGLSADADVAHVKITSGLPGTPLTSQTYDYGSFLTGGSSAGNPELHDGDVIYVAHKSPVSISVSITGDVAQPGRYDMPQGSTFYDLVTKAGGLTKIADRDNIYIQPMGTLDHESVKYDAASSNPEDPNSNPVLHDGDKVVVSELASTQNYSITGGVLAPGQRPFVGPLTLTDALDQAQGPQPRAQLNKTQITRQTSNGAEVLHVDAKDPKVAGNFQIQPGDSIYIPPGTAPSFQVNPFEIIGLLISAYAIFR